MYTPTFAEPPASFVSQWVLYSARAAWGFRHFSKIKYTIFHHVGWNAIAAADAKKEGLRTSTARNASIISF